MTLPPEAVGPGHASPAADAPRPATLQAAGEATLVADADGRISGGSQALAERLGYGLEELRELRAADLIVLSGPLSPADRARFTREGYWRGELLLRRKDGGLVAVAALVTAGESPSRGVYVATFAMAGS